MKLDKNRENSIHFGSSSAFEAEPPNESLCLGSEDSGIPHPVRLLASNTAAGCIMGKGGAKFNEFQSESGGRIQLSRSHEFLSCTSYTEVDGTPLLSKAFPEVSDQLIEISNSPSNLMKIVKTQFILVPHTLLRQKPQMNHNVWGPRILKLLIRCGSWRRTQQLGA